MRPLILILALFCMGFTYPQNCRTGNEHMEYLYSCKEQLRLKHNEQAKELSPYEFSRWKKSWWQPRQNKISKLIAELKPSILPYPDFESSSEKEKAAVETEYEIIKKAWKESKKWDVSLDNILSR